MAKAGFNLSAAEAATRLATGSFDTVSLAANSSLADKVLRAAAGYSDMARQTAKGGTIAEAMRQAAKGGTIDEAMRQAAGLGASLAGGATSVDNMLASKGLLGQNRDLFDIAVGKASALGRTIDAVAGFRGVSATAVDALRDRLSKFEIANENLGKQLSTSQMRGLLGQDEANFRTPEFPRIEPNPIHKTNQLLDEVIGELGDQRALIEATAEAQKRETELLGKLVEAFTESQIASERSARRSHLQAWIGIGLTVLALIIAWLSK